ncbi:hypothetical protein R75777_06985 [Paraburkholderia nemoris]|nr:hypothetical protein R75777_06985 [Paraburkholderia nemoris]
MNTAHLEMSSRRAPVPQFAHSVELGGVDAGLFSPPDGSQPYRLIVALLPEAHLEATRWGPYGLDANATSDWDGRANTDAILRADPSNAIAQQFRDIEIDGHRDFYWAAKLETDHIYRTMGDLVRQFLSSGVAWTSTQYSANDAWGQDFLSGYTDFWLKGSIAGALAVRRFYPLVLQ